MVGLKENFRADGGLLVLGNLGHAKEVHLCRTERDARALWSIYRHKKAAVAVIATPYPEELVYLQIPAEAKLFAWPPNKATDPIWGPATNPKLQRLPARVRPGRPSRRITDHLENPDVPLASIVACQG